MHYLQSLTSSRDVSVVEEGMSLSDVGLFGGTRHQRLRGQRFWLLCMRRKCGELLGSYLLNVLLFGGALALPLSPARGPLIPLLPGSR